MNQEDRCSRCGVVRLPTQRFVDTVAGFLCVRCKGELERRDVLGEEVQDRSPLDPFLKAERANGKACRERVREIHGGSAEPEPSGLKDAVDRMRSGKIEVTPVAAPLGRLTKEEADGTPPDGFKLVPCEAGREYCDGCRNFGQGHHLVAPKFCRHGYERGKCVVRYDGAQGRRCRHHPEGADAPPATMRWKPEIPHDGIPFFTPDAAVWQLPDGTLTRTDPKNGSEPIGKAYRLPRDFDAEAPTQRERRTYESGRAEGEKTGRAYAEAEAKKDKATALGALPFKAASPLEDLLEEAWGVIANAHGGNWKLASKVWQEAADRWRDEWERTLHGHRATNETCMHLLEFGSDVLRCELAEDHTGDHKATGHDAEGPMHYSWLREGKDSMKASWQRGQ